MELKILKQEKEDLELELDNLTLAEILRDYLNKDKNVNFAAWRREHPTKKPVLVVKAKNPKKAVNDAVSAIIKNLDKIEEKFEGMK